MPIDINALAAFVTAFVAAIISLLTFRSSARKDEINLLREEVARLHARQRDMQIEHDNERVEWENERERLWERIRQQGEQIAALTAERNQLRQRVDELEAQMRLRTVADE